MIDIVGATPGRLFWVDGNSKILFVGRPLVARRECAVLEALRVDASIDPYSVGADSISARFVFPSANGYGRI